MSITSQPKIEHLVGTQHLKLFASLSQGADGVRGLKGNKGEKVRLPHGELPQMPIFRLFLTNRCVDTSEMEH